MRFLRRNASHPDAGNYRFVVQRRRRNHRCGLQNGPNFENVTETFLERYGVQLSLYKSVGKNHGEKVNNVYIYAVSIMRLISF